MFLFNSSCRPIREQISAEAPVSAQVLWSGSLKRWNWEWGLVHIVCFWSVWGSDGVSLEETEPPYQDTTHFLSWRKWGGSGEEGGGGGEGADVVDEGWGRQSVCQQSYCGWDTTTNWERLEDKKEDLKEEEVLGKRSGGEKKKKRRKWSRRRAEGLCWRRKVTVRKHEVH